jgi:cytochrome c-type biogenesis protein CcmE
MKRFRLVVTVSFVGICTALLVYGSVVATDRPTVRPGDLDEHEGGSVTLTGVVHGRVSGDATRGSGLRFHLRDRAGTASVAVIYRGSVSDLFRSGGELSVDGEMRGGHFIAKPGTMISKPSSAAPAAAD